jgi:hypothetical protein
MLDNTNNITDVIVGDYIDCDIYDALFDYKERKVHHFILLQRTKSTPFYLITKNEKYTISFYYNERKVHQNTKLKITLKDLLCRKVHF